MLNTALPPTERPPTASAAPAAPTLPSPAIAVHDDLRFNTTPNLLTLLRMCFVPVVVGFLFFRDPAWDIAAGWAFAVASMTDYLDGYLARTRKLETVYGKLMDPLADKFLVVSALIMLQYLGRIHPVLVMALICREMAITGLRALASAEGVIIAASDSGKWKTASQMVAIPFLIAGRDLLGLPTYAAGLVLLYISLAISLWSAKDYVVGFFRGVTEARRLKTSERRAAKAARLAARSARMARRERKLEQQQAETRAAERSVETLAEKPNPPEK